MITGQQAFSGPSTAVVFDGILNRMPPPVGLIASDIPPEMERIVNTALQKDREQPIPIGRGDASPTWRRCAAGGHRDERVPVSAASIPASAASVPRAAAEPVSPITRPQPACSRSLQRRARCPKVTDVSRCGRRRAGAGGRGGSGRVSLARPAAAAQQPREARERRPPPEERHRRSRPRRLSGDARTGARAGRPAVAMREVGPAGPRSQRPCSRTSSPG